MLRKACYLVLSVWLVFPGQPLLAQLSTAAISGTVKDETGAVLPGASIRIKNLDTGITRTAITDELGRYHAPNLTLGNYEVTAELAGFQSGVRSGIKLTVGREAVVDFTLKVGEITERLVVMGEAPLVDTRHAQVSGLIDDRKIRDLPLNARSFIDLALLQAGSLQSRTSDTGFGEEGTHITVSGTRPTATTFMLDGTVTTSSRGKAPVSVSGQALGVEAIREFTVITSPYSAEYGRGGGGTINVVSRSGTNEFHGSLFHFLRNDNLDARNFFDPLEGPPEFKRNQFGFSAGGPIIRNKTFFFANYEGLRQGLGQTTISRVPSLDARQGMIRGRRVSIKPEIRPYLELFPIPNGRDFGDGRAEFIASFTRRTDEDYFTTRIDHAFSEKNSFFARYTISDGSDLTPGGIPQLFAEQSSSRNQYLTIEDQSIVSPRLVNIFRFGYTRNRIESDNALRIKLDPSLSIQPGRLMPALSVSGLASLGPADTLPRFFIDNIYDFYDHLNYIVGRHSIKAGVQLQRIQHNVFFNTRQNGRLNFSSLEDFFAGNASRLQIAPRQFADPLRYFRQSFIASYFQDDVQLTPRLTLNLGLRYEFTTTLWEKFGKQARIPSGKYATASLDDIVVGPPWYDNPEPTGFAPRIGLAWDPTGSGKSALRAGFGIFYDHFWAWWISGTGAFRMAPFYSIFELRSVSFPTTIDRIIAELKRRQGREIPVGTQTYQFDENLSKQYTMRFSFDLQREVAADTVVKVGYSGSRGVHLGRIVDVNTAVPERIADGVPFFSTRPSRRNPNYEVMLTMVTETDSFYHALLLEVNKKFSRGFQFQAAYTLSKLIDEAAGVRTSGDAIEGAGGGTMLSWQFKRLDRSLSTFDVRHNFVANYTFDVPVGSGRALSLNGLADRVLGGWQINGILTLASGNPAMIEQGTTASTAILGGFRRPDLLPGRSQNPRLGGPDRYFDPTVFAFAPPERYGTLGRNTLIGPGFANFDFSLVKNMPVRSISESFNIAFRAEFFNLFNRANFSLPETEVFDGRGRSVEAAGRITRTVSSSRQIQFGLKITF